MHKHPNSSSLPHPMHNSKFNAPGKAVAAVAFGLLICGNAMGRGGATPPSAGDSSPFPAATPQAVVEVTARIFPAVVRLDVAQEIYSEGKRTVQRGIGSGVIFDDDGRILTNFHVA